MAEYRYPSWEAPLNEAASESDLALVRKKVEETEAAIFIRSIELRQSRDGHEEFEAMHRAAAQLLLIKRDKLKWPSPFTPNGNGNGNGDGGSSDR